MKSFEQNQLTNDKNLFSRSLKARLKTRILVDGGDPEETRRFVVTAAAKPAPEATLIDAATGSIPVSQ